MINLNIHMQIIGLVLAVMIIIMNSTRKKIGLMADFSFELLSVSVAVSIVFDIWSVFTINLANDRKISESYNMFVCKTYIVTLTLVAAMALFYTLTEIYGGAVLKRGALFGYVLLELLAIPAIYVLPLDYYIDVRSIYSYGYSTDIGAAVGLVFLVLSCAYIILFRKRIDHSRINAITVFCIAMTAGAAFQAFNRRHLIASVTVAIGTIYIYLRLEDPSSYTNKDTDTFNVKALAKYLDGIYSEGKQVSLMYLNLAGSRFFRDVYGDDKYHKLMASLVKYLEGSKKRGVFNTDEMDFIIVFDGNANIENEVFSIRQDLMSLWSVDDIKVELNPTIISFPKENIPYSTADDVISTLRFFATEMKENGRKDYMVIGPNDIKEKEQKDLLENMLLEAMDNNNIEVFYQPIYDLKTGKIFAAEALARVRNANGEFIVNDDIIPVAERSGIILRMGFRIFEGVCKFVSANPLKKLKVKKITVNLSSAQCIQRNFADDMIELMKMYDIAGSNFIFEITQSGAVLSKESLMRNLYRLSSYGVEIASDQFGKKMGGFEELTALPISIVKIDREVLRTCFSEESGEMEKAGFALVALIKKMGKKVAAVGVEDEHMLEELKKVKAHYVQGRLMCDAVDSETFVKLCKGEIIKDEQG
ncbi:MAG: EAL domain-containing protein [Lachnospiraceae bacterium]|nr:EAL domain-containing protein [Lachnospiraceae bacterium]